jgi:hypothetical protein
MKKIIFGLLIIAAGTGIYFVLQKKQVSPKPTPDKTLIVGTWKIDTIKGHDTASITSTKRLVSADSNFRRKEFNFQTAGAIIQTLKDSTLSQTDTLHYNWKKDNSLVIRLSATDSISYRVSLLTSDSLLLLSPDSTLLVFRKATGLLPK